MKARKKPVIIDFIIWDGYNVKDIIDFTNGKARKEIGDLSLIHINTLEGKMCADSGDYIIKGVNGEFYPCKPDIFKKTYEIIEY